MLSKWINFEIDIIKSNIITKIITNPNFEVHRMIYFTLNANIIVVCEISKILNDLLMIIRWVDSMHNSNQNCFFKLSQTLKKKKTKWTLLKLTIPFRQVKHINIIYFVEV